MADLEKMILAKRQNGFDKFLGNLEKKYCVADNKEPDEDSDGWVDEVATKKRKQKPVQQLTTQKKRKIWLIYDKI